VSNESKGNVSQGIEDLCMKYIYLPDKIMYACKDVLMLQVSTAGQT
jgi:hypothetical protein